MGLLDQIVVEIVAQQAVGDRHLAEIVLMAMEVSMECLGSCVRQGDTKT